MLKAKEKDLLLTKQGSNLKEDVSECSLVQCLCGMAIHFVEIKGKTFRSFYHETNLLKYLDSLGITYEVQNDAPKKGRKGDYVKLTKQLSKRRRIVQALLDNNWLLTKNQRELQSKNGVGVADFYINIHKIANDFVK